MCERGKELISCDAARAVSRTVTLYGLTILNVGVKLYPMYLFRYLALNYLTNRPDSTEMIPEPLITKFRAFYGICSCIYSRLLD